MTIRIRRRAPVTVAFVREMGPYMESANKAWPRLAGWLEQVDVVHAESVFLGIMHDDFADTPPDLLRYDAAVTMPEDFTPQDDAVQVQRLEGGEYAVALHVGPYEKLGEAWDGLMEWLVAKGREPADGPCFEIYRNDPRVTAPEDLHTELNLPLKPRP